LAYAYFFKARATRNAELQNAHAGSLLLAQMMMQRFALNAGGETEESLHVTVLECVSAAVIASKPTMQLMNRSE